MICEATTEAPRAELSAAVDAVKFMFGGNAIFTLQSAVSGTRFTFRVQKSDDGKMHFVKVLTGSDNETDYEYFGFIRANGQFVPGNPEKVRVSLTAPSVVAFRWAYQRLAAGIMPEKLTIWHEGRCARCARTLTVPSSIASGFGPECIKKG